MYCVCHEIWHGIFSISIDSDQIYEYVSVNLQPGILLKIYWRFKIEPHCFNGCAYQRRPQILAAIFRNMVIFMLSRRRRPKKICPGLSYCNRFPQYLTNKLIVAKSRYFAINLLIDSHYIFIPADNSHSSTASWMAKTLLRTSQHLIPVITWNSNHIS